MRVARVLASSDRRLTRRAARLHGSPADRLLVTVTRMADRSLLWLSLAGVLAVVGGRGGRRASRQGVLAIAIASGTVNGPLKMLLPRRRPSLRRWPPLVAMPKSSSFPSGHAASAFAFASATSAEIPVLAAVLVPLAATVAYSRVHVGVHHPTDVVVGAALGVAAGALSGHLSDRLEHAGDAPPDVTGSPARDIVLVTSPDSGGSEGLAQARRALASSGFTTVEQLEVSDLARLATVKQGPDGAPRLIIAAGGDGTVGAVADCLADSESILGVLPLGTSNDFARSLSIPVDPQAATALLTTGKISTIDLGRLVVPGEPARHFVHAATIGLTVNFAKLATQASLRRRLGHFTYTAAAIMAMREDPTFDCELTHHRQTDRLRLTQLSIINAPVFGGALGMRVGGSDPDDRKLDVLAIEGLAPQRLLLIALYAALGIKRGIHGVRAFHVDQLRAHSDRTLEVALDGEVAGHLPADFEVAGEALRVITPLDFDDVDD